MNDAEKKELIQRELKAIRASDTDAQIELSLYKIFYDAYFDGYRNAMDTATKIIKGE